ncbi:hypothetical protein GCK72_025228 [Caenorhabditis remanei]|uniref:Seven TM Receptor n=1 Tax=Caenorhabditis remanei TaxID=31234 RepID=A0A6A5G1X1_CAERE|nr:hypothetical protein GCK72_025228 [Caenorhabditis remanei]KAF1748761.1 hypothetical protein GCK72_025228 [Caenorhabditis remanei]
MTKTYLFWVSLAQTVGKFAFATTTFSGLILIYFNFFEVKKIFGTYKYLMVIFTSMGIGLATLEVVFHPWYIGAYYLLEPDNVTKEYFKEELLQRYSVVINDLPFRAFMAYDPVDRSIRWVNWLFAFIVTGIMAFQYGIMIYCGWAMYSGMEEKMRNFSSALKHHHNQLFKTLVFQISTPTIFLFSPLVLVIYLPFFDIELSFPAGATVCAFNFYPAVDVVIVLYVVTEYRVAAKKYLNIIRNQFKSSSSKYAENNQQTQQTYQLSTLPA